MNRLLLGLLALGLIVTGVKLDRRRSRPPSFPRSDINDWEGEGGAVPVSDQRTAAQTTAVI